MRALERVVRRIVLLLDATANRLYGVRWNPIHQSGTVSVAMLLVLLVTGLVLVVFYRVGSPATSVAQLAADPWLGAWIRTLHRYASDLFVLAALLHLLRMLAQERSWGPRTLAWISGLALFGTGVVCAWTGFVMAWDSFGERLARDGARLLDVLPILSEPMSRIFAGDRPVPSAFFFVNLFVHIGLPLAMGAMLWLHVSRVARPVLIPPKRLTWALTATLTLASVLLPAPIGPPASAFRLHPATPVDLIVAWWLPITERLPAGIAWTALLAVAVLGAVVPRLTRRPRAGRFAPSVVDPRLCTGCNQCPQDCPWDAITMIPREDGRPTLLAFVDASRCVSCGICAASCAPMGVGPPGRTGRDQLAALRNDVLPALQPSGRQSIVAICCAQTPRRHRDALRVRDAFVYEVPCVGNTHTSIIEHVLRAGAPGVVVGGCPPRDCVNREGPKWLGERTFNDREAELPPRVDRRRVRIITMAPGELSATIEAYEDFVASLSLLSSTAPLPDETGDATCVPAPFAEETS